MSSVSFQNTLTPEQVEMMSTSLGTPSVFDGITALYDVAIEVDSQTMSDLARETKSPVEVGIHSEGEIKTMRDGTQYRVTSKGWRKVGA